MTRRQIREEIFKLIFQIEFHDTEELPQQLRLSLEEETDLGEQQVYVEDKCRDLMDKVQEIDDCINENVTGWKTSRMSKVDLSIIRLAVYEIRYEKIDRAIRHQRGGGDREKIQRRAGGVLCQRRSGQDRMKQNIYSVSQVNAYVSRMFEEDFLLKKILIQGEVSNCKYHSSGHNLFYTEG